MLRGMYLGFRLIFLTTFYICDTSWLYFVVFFPCTGAVIIFTALLSVAFLQKKLSAYVIRFAQIPSSIFFLLFFFFFSFFFFFFSSFFQKFQFYISDFSIWLFRSKWVGMFVVIAGLVGAQLGTLLNPHQMSARILTKWLWILTVFLCFTGSSGRFRYCLQSAEQCWHERHHHWRSADHHGSGLVTFFVHRKITGHHHRFYDDFWF